MALCNSSKAILSYFKRSSQAFFVVEGISLLLINKAECSIRVGVGNLSSKLRIHYSFDEGHYLSQNKASNIFVYPFKS